MPVHQRSSEMKADKKVLLILDDDKYMVRALLRSFDSLFDEIFGVTDPDEATSILELNRVSHIICDLNLGVNVETGTNGFTLSTLWRKRFPTIERIVIYSGEPLGNISIPPEIDAVVQKTKDIAFITDRLLERAIV